MKPAARGRGHGLRDTSGEFSVVSRAVRRFTTACRAAAWRRGRGDDMCRNIRTLANFEPPATEEEIRASALQFVRKLSGTNKPSRANEAAFNQALEEVTAAATRLVRSFTTSAPPRHREEEMRKAKARALKRYA